MTPTDKDPQPSCSSGFLDEDSQIDFVLVGDTGITAYRHDGKELWKLKESSTYNQRKDQAEKGQHCPITLQQES